jgi:hypothetical protein
MMDFQRRIDDLEKRSQESALIAQLATDPDVRLHNTNLAKELSRLATELRKQLPLLRAL